jgi:transposase-like protein
MAQKRKHYSKQFKVDAVKLVTGQGYKVSEAALKRHATLVSTTVL